jgi:hypothetical protein
MMRVGCVECTTTAECSPARRSLPPAMTVAALLRPQFVACVSGHHMFKGGLLQVPGWWPRCAGGALSLDQTTERGSRGCTGRWHGSNGRPASEWPLFLYIRMRPFPPTPNHTTQLCSASLRRAAQNQTPCVLSRGHNQPESDRYSSVQVSRTKDQPSRCLPGPCIPTLTRGEQEKVPVQRLSLAGRPLQPCMHATISCGRRKRRHTHVGASPDAAHSLGSCVEARMPLSPLLVLRALLAGRAPCSLHWRAALARVPHRES